jgi:hypothetical protein
MSELRVYFNPTSKLKIDFNPTAKLTVAFNPTSMVATTGQPIARDYIECEPYEGNYEITPSSETIVMETINKRMTDNVRILPIPSNYGLITWNGSTLTVS